MFRENWVRIESFPEDFRNAPLNYNLIQTIVIPDCAKEPSRLGKVLALGNGRMQNGEHYEFSVQVGDVVLTNRYPQSGKSFKHGDEEVFLMRESEILAVVNL